MKSETNFLPYYIALKFKELNFDYPCFGYFNSKEDIVTNEFVIDMAIKNIKVPFDDQKSVHYIGVSAPLWQQVDDWFLTKYNIDIKTNYLNLYKTKGWSYIIYPNVIDESEIFIDSIIDLNIPLYEDKYTARISAILKAIDIVNQNNQNTK